jgi:DNA-binding transcriptional LysR family regulator
MDLAELQVFLTVAREGSFSRAAERLYRTQPAVSLAIRKLEDSLGQPLFVRGARPVRLTDAGTLLREYAERLLNLRDEVKKGLLELAKPIPACRSVCTACSPAIFPMK